MRLLVVEDEKRMAELLRRGLGWSHVCRYQAFRIGQAYGLQFHLEVTPDMVADWLSHDANLRDVAELTAPVDPAGNAERLEPAVGWEWHFRADI